MILNTMWPMLLDMSRDECKRILRRLELEAYSSIVSALRAQGALSKDKHKLLQDLANILNISLERHRAEVRRAVNDEKLATIAEHMAGPNTSTEWAIEGRRLIPLMPRLVPQTAFTALANKMANITAAENAKLPPPAQTLKFKEPNEEILSAESFRHETVCGTRPSGSPPGRSVLPVKRPEREDERSVKRRCRSTSSSESIPVGPAQTMSPPLPRSKIAALSSPQTTLVQQQQQVPNQPQLLQQQSQTSFHSQSQPQINHSSQSQVQHNELQPSLQSQQFVKPPPPQSLTQTSHLQSVQLPLSQRQPLQQQQVIHQHQPVQQQQSQQQQLQLQSQHQQQHQHSTIVHQDTNKDSQSINIHSMPQGQNSHAQMATVKVQEVIVGAQSPPTPSIQTQAASHTRVISGGTGSAPVKITFTSSAGRSALCNIGTSTTTTLTTTSPAPTTQKVIIVQSSGTGGGPGPPSILQRSLTVPVVKSSPAAAAAAAAAATAVGGGPNSASRASLIISGPSGSPPVTPTTIVTISTNPVNSNNVTATTVSIGGVPTTAYITSPGSIPHIRQKAVQLPSRMRPRAGSIVIPVTPNTLGSAGSLPGVTLKTTPIQTPRSGVHVKTECSGMKILPVAAGSGGTTKILPKPSFGSGSSQTPMYMMSNTTSNITMVTRTVSASCPGSRVVTVNATTLPSSVSSIQGRPITTTLVSKAASVAGSGRTPAQGKPNVIVVQKGTGGSFPRGVSVSGGRVQNFPASLQDVINKVVGSKTLGVSGSGSGNSNSSHVTTLNMQKTQQQGLHLPTNSQAGNVVVLDLSHENVGKNMVLADILQASGITSETDVDASVIEKGEKQGQQVPSSNSSLPVPMDISHSLQINKRSAGSAQGGRVGGDIVEVTGELDPQTGIYSIHSEPVPDLVSQGSSVTIVPNTGSMDIFSTALASADINLDSFQYMEEGLEAVTGTSQPSSSIEVTVGEDNRQVQVIGESLQFLHDTEIGVTEPAAVTVEPSHIDTTGMHLEDYSSQKVQGQGAIE